MCNVCVDIYIVFIICVQSVVCVQSEQTVKRVGHHGHPSLKSSLLKMSEDSLFFWYIFPL